jgi:hypothetical protein
MWSASKIKLVLVAQGRLIPPPSGWIIKRRKIPHGLVGGVTNIIGHLGIYIRSDPLTIANVLDTSKITSVRPRRDLRSVMKMAIGGNRCGAPSDSQQMSVPVGLTVLPVRPGVILNCGLLEVKFNKEGFHLPRVKTIFGGSMWVIRRLTSSETLACWDAPEKLGQIAQSEDIK